MIAPFTHPLTRIAQKLAKAAGLFVLGLLMLGTAAWGALALHYWDHAGSNVRNVLAAAWVLASLTLIAGFLFPRSRWRSVADYAVLFAALLAAWSTLEPSNDRVWAPENARLSYATIDGERITLHNIRNFDYRGETDFTAAYYDRTFDLREINEVDLFVAYWMGPAIAHVFLSFGFANGAHVAISVETRREQGQTYSSVQGFFRQYTLYYAVGDERDIVRVRTNYRVHPPERVFMYRLRGSRTDAETLFLGYLRRINSLKERAEWYNSLTSNCTNSIWLLTRLNPNHVPYSWRVMLSGYLPEYLYAQRKLDTRVPFTELRRRALINARAQSANDNADFSQRIRSEWGSAARGTADR